jgi:hypothetical protein
MKLFASSIVSLLLGAYLFSLISRNSEELPNYSLFAFLKNDRLYVQHEHFSTENRFIVSLNVVSEATLETSNFGSSVSGTSSSGSGNISTPIVQILKSYGSGNFHILALTMEEGHPKTIKTYRSNTFQLTHK